MLSHHLRFLFVLSSLISSCLAFSANEPQSTGTVASPVDRVPNCAADCTREFIRTDYPSNSCSQGLDLGCLCRTNTNSGYTLGEAALRCSLAYCVLETVLRSTVYSICDVVEGALPRTHATITATIVTTTTTSLTSTTAAHTETPSDLGTLSTSLSTSSTTSSTTSSAPSQSTTTHTSTTLTPFESPISITHTTLHSSTTNDQTPSTSAASSNESHLKPSAVIGVSVASGVSGFLIIGVIIFCCCRKARRRNQQAKDNNFFEIGGVMSEPHDFSSPSRRPIPGPSNPSSRTINEDSRPARLMSPFEYRNENPAVVVTGPDGDRNNRHSRRISPSKIGFAFSSNSENEASPSQSSQRTISDLLPEKPAYDLYPQPLRWSQQKTPRPASGATLFEEDVVRPRGGPSAPTPFMNSSALPAQYNSSRQYNRAPMAGLPDNPRAMMHGFEGRHNGTLTPRNPVSRKKPTYADSGAGVHPPRQADIYDASYHTEWDDLMYHDNYVDNYWQQPDHGYLSGADMPLPRNMKRRSLPQSSSIPVSKPSGEFETININENSGSRRTSRHSGSFRPLSPLKEVRTPTNIPPKREYSFGDAPVNEPERSRSTAVGPAHEIVSRPRIVQQDDIKRVQVRRGKPQPTGQTVPYAPDDYWHENHRGILIPELNSHGLVSDSRYPIERMGRTSTIRAVPTERNLTPSRHGTDLILRVD